MDKGWDLTEILLTIKNELYDRETCENSKIEKEPELPFSGTVLHANQKPNPSNLLCAFCKENQFFNKCPEVTDIATRRKYLYDCDKTARAGRGGVARELRPPLF